MRFMPSTIDFSTAQEADWPPSTGHLAGQGTPQCQSHDLVTAGDVVVSTIECELGDRVWSYAPSRKNPAIVLVRLGRFVRRVNGRIAVVDATQGYVQDAGETETIQHLGELGHRCTVITVRPEALPSLWRARARLMPSEFRTTPATDLSHRRLLAECRRGADVERVSESAAALVADLFESCMRAPRPTHRRGTNAATRRIVDIARELATSESGSHTLCEVAEAASVSPHHLTRAFKENTGMTMSRYRNRVRVRLALEWIAEGDDDFTRIAHDLGFSDHAHFSRTVMAEVGLQPRTVRRLLYTGEAKDPASDR
jgi:AraC-like DNA-binding protein